MPKGPIRRAQLIAPFGVGAMVVVRDGTSLIAAGLDHWYKREDFVGGGQNIDPDDFALEEWRLQRRLRVSHFRLPPDYRKSKRGQTIPNCYMTIPFLRFPQWHYCPRPGCNSLQEISLFAGGRIPCIECEKRGRKSYLVQVPVVAMCDQGHVQDFPWREWVHKSIRPACKLPMRLVATGSASLAAQKVICDCGAKRSLAQVTSADPDGNRTHLSQSLDETGALFMCQGKRPWLGTGVGVTCSRPIKGSLRSASNVYFAQVQSAIYLPRGNRDVPSELVSILEAPPLSTLIKLLQDLTIIRPEQLRGQHGALLARFPDHEIAGALQMITADRGQAAEVSEHMVETDDPETGFRRSEFQVLRSPRNEDQLKIKAADLNDYASVMRHYFSRIMLIDKLRETRALTGFTRVFPDNDQTLEQRRSLLWNKEQPSNDSWLPAYVVFGEGIFIEFSESRLQAWERTADVATRINRLVARYSNAQQQRRLRDEIITPRLVLLHTFAHILINRLTFECGYSSASLRERLYVSDNKNEPMAGVLLYTAAGDAEGTMGGLVRMGKPGHLEPMIRRALEAARWCSADPVCMELGESGGQGPDSCNLAACHNCALVPETACESFNRFLDRGLLVGALANPNIGYFAEESFT